MTRDTGADGSVSKRTGRKDPAIALETGGRCAQGEGSTGAWACSAFKIGLLLLRLERACEEKQASHYSRIPDR